MKSVDIINGVTKVESVRGFVYSFPLQVIETITDGDYLIRRERGNSSYEQIRFIDLDNNLFASNIEQYADKLAAGNYFKDSAASVAIEAKDNRGSGETYSDYETQTLSLANKGKEQLDQIIFLLKKIAE